jgi:hypothetical protein
VVRGFLWCAAKQEPQLDAHAKQAYRLDGKWPDKETRAIVSVHTCAEGGLASTGA